METEPRGERRRRRQQDEEPLGREDIVIRLPRIDPAFRDLLLDMIPGRALMRVLCEMPDEVTAHLQGARRERLLALRGLIDALIEDTERPRARRRAQEVEIE